MKRRFLGLLACTVVLGLGGLGAAGCGSDASTVVNDDSDVATPEEGTTPEGADDEVVPPAPTTEDCAVAGDEDADGSADCLDTDCAADPACAAPPPAVEGNCTDGLDEDADGSVDCVDADCAADAACAAPPPAEDCSTSADEDGDGQGQCSDSDCAGDPACSGGGGSWEIDPHFFDKYKAVEKFPWPGPGPECLSCPYEFGTYEDMVTNPAI